MNSEPPNETPILNKASRELRKIDSLVNIFGIKL